MSALDLLAAALLLAGTGFTVLAGVGVLRFPGPFTRMHAATKSSSLGVALVLLGAAIRVESRGDAGKLLLVIAFQFLTAPIAAHMVGRAAYRAGQAGRLRPDELAELERAEPADGGGPDGDAPGPRNGARSGDGGDATGGAKGDTRDDATAG